MEVWSGDVRLEGTLSVPDDPGLHPAALLLNGSGPLDRDSNMAGQRLDVAKALATSLAARVSPRCASTSVASASRAVSTSRRACPTRPPMPAVHSTHCGRDPRAPAASL